MTKVGFPRSGRFPHHFAKTSKCTSIPFAGLVTHDLGHYLLDQLVNLEFIRFFGDASE